MVNFFIFFIYLLIVEATYYMLY